MRHYARRARAGNTQRLYAAQWRMFERWCATRGWCSLPAEPIGVAAYLAQRAEAVGV